MAVTISYNNLTNPQNTVVFSNFPQILKITDFYSAGNKAYRIMTVNEKIADIANNKEFSITINDETIYSTRESSEATGNKFWITNNNTDANRLLIANSICNALRSLTSLPINYDIFLDRDENQQIIPSVVVIAKEVGSLYRVNYSASETIDWLSARTNYGSVTSIFKNDGNTKICVDVYKKYVLIDTDAQTEKTDYVTTLSKTWYGEVMYFDLQPLFASLVEDGEPVRVDLTVYAVNYNLTTLASYKEIFVANGYSVNQGLPYLQFDDIYFATNVSRGENKGYYNNTLLYVYEPVLYFSLYSTSKLQHTNYKVKYLNSAYEVFLEEEKRWDLNNPLVLVETVLNSEAFSKSYFIDVTIDGIGTIRYNVIKPIKATGEEQRVYWYNSYGGVSFWDFTGNRQETRKTKIEYYQTQLFDYYDKDRTSTLNKVYDKDITVEVNLSTHNIEKDGTWSLFDLQNSKVAWTYVNGQKYFITITDLKITESQVKDIYVGQITYEYQTGDTF